MSSIVTAFVVVMQKLMSVMNVEDLILMVMDYVTQFVRKFVLNPQFPNVGDDNVCVPELFI